MTSTEVSGTQAMPPKNSKARGRKRSDVKRDRIVRSAAKLFLDKGYESVSINDIIEVVGGSKATIYSACICRCLSLARRN